MTRDEIELTVRRSVIGGGFRFGIHCSEQMEKRNVGTQDLENVLLKGQIIKIEDRGQERYKCHVKGVDLDGDKLTVIVGLDGYGAKCITVF